MQCRTCGEHGKEGLSSLDPEHASLLPQLAACSSFVCHDCIVEFKHWRHFLTRFQTSQTLFQQVLESKQHSDSPQKTDVEPSLEKILPKCRVLVPKLLECEMCNYFTTNKSQLTTHMQDHQSRNTSGGSSRSRSRGQPAKKAGTKSGKKPASKYRKMILKCQHCGLKYGRPETFAWHTEYCHGTDAIVEVVKVSEMQYGFKCKLCETVCRHQEKIMYHLRSQHQAVIQPYQCDNCVKRFSCTQKLKRHQFKCKKTNVKFCSTVHDYNVESAVQGAMKITFVKCKICDEIFESEFQMNKHIFAFHAKKLHRFKCEHCDELFNFYTNLKSHCRSIHPRKYVFLCKVCKAEFSSLSGFTSHEKFVHKAQQFTCNICSVKFSHPNSLKLHISVLHPLVKKSFSCKLCSAKFKCKQYLHKHHITTHYGSILYCNHCNYKTRRRSALISHLKLKHIPLKKLMSCKFCSAKMKCKYLLRKHIDEVHTGPILKCAHCKYGSRRKRDLNKHVRSRHFHLLI